jgi:hypothetical protein
MRFITRNDILTKNTVFYSVFFVPISGVIVTSFCVELYSDAAAVLEDAVIIDVSNSVGIDDVAVTFEISGCIADDTFSVIAFIILYGLLLVPRSDLGKY